MLHVPDNPEDELSTAEWAILQKQHGQFGYLRCTRGNVVAMYMNMRLEMASFRPKVNHSTIILSSRDSEEDIAIDFQRLSDQ